MKLGKLSVIDGSGTFEMAQVPPVFCVIQDWTNVVLTTQGVPMAFPSQAAAEGFIRSCASLKALGEGTVKLGTKGLQELLNPVETAAKVPKVAPKTPAVKAKATRKVK
jgi:hypothetical protein